MSYENWFVQFWYPATVGVDSQANINLFNRKMPIARAFSPLPKYL